MCGVPLRHNGNFGGIVLSLITLEFEFSGYTGRETSLPRSRSIFLGSPRMKEHWPSTLCGGKSSRGCTQLLLGGNPVGGHVKTKMTV